MAGYSQKPLWQKLGIKENSLLCIIHAPDGYEKLLTTPFSLKIEHKLKKGSDIIHFFTKGTDELTLWFPVLTTHLAKSGSLWISWPKGGSKITTDLNENIIRDIGLAEGLVDVKVIAVDDTWSGLKFVYRLKDRT